MVLCQTIRRTPPSWFAGTIGKCVCESERCSGILGRIPGGHFQGVAVFVFARRPSPLSFWFFVFNALCASLVRTFLQILYFGRTSTFGTKTLNFVALLTLDQISALPQIARSAPSPRVCLLRAQIATTQQKIEMRCISESQPPPSPPAPPPIFLFSVFSIRARTCIRTNVHLHA